MKQYYAWLLAILAWASAVAFAAEGVRPARDLQRDAAAARAVNDPIRYFDGRPTTTSRVATRHGDRPAPTVLLDGKGRMLSKPVVGLTTVDYYGMYLDEAIDTAVAKVRASHRPAG